MKVEKSPSLGRNTLTTALAGALGAGTTVVLDAIVVALFGMGWQTDAYFVAITIPLLLITILQLQGSRVVQAMFIHRREKAGAAQGWVFLNAWVTTGTIVLLVAATLGAALSPLLIRIQAPGLDPTGVRLAIRLSWLFFLTIPLYCPVTIMRVALNSLDSFALPGAMKFFESGCKIIFLLMLGRRIGVIALALGAFAGAVFQVGVFYHAMRRKGYRFAPLLSFYNPDIIDGARMMLYPMVGQVTSIATEMANNVLGSLLGTGCVSALRLATRIIDSLAGLCAHSIVIAAMPAVTATLSCGDYERAKGIMREGIYLLLLITLPLSAFLLAIHEPLIAFIYQRESFSLADTQLVSRVFLLMIPYIFLSRLLSLCELVFFGKCDTRTPLVGSVSVTLIYFGVTFALLWTLKIYALPIARSCAYLCGSLLLVYLAHRRIGGFHLRSLVPRAGRILVASMATGLCAVVGVKAASSAPLHGFALRLACLAIPSLSAGVALIGSLVGLGLVNRDTLGPLRLVGRIAASPNGACTRP